MRLAIMQPYLFPYLGYFQLINSVDRFVFLDDVNFIKRGWINRNRLLLSGIPAYFTAPLVGASQNHKINELQISMEGGWQRKLSASIRQSYAKAPNYDFVSGLIDEVLFLDKCSIAEMARDSIMRVAEYLGLNADFVQSSSVYGNAELKGSARILDICRLEGASSYHNLPGGRELYDPAIFAADQIELAFIEPHLPAYPQFSNVFQPGLSIVDVLMHNEPAAVRRMM